MDAEKRRGGAGDEDAGLVDGVVGWVEGAEGVEGRSIKRKQEGRGDAKVDGVFG